MQSAVTSPQSHIEKLYHVYPGLRGYASSRHCPINCPIEEAWLLSANCTISDPAPSRPKSAYALYFAHYSFCRVHSSLRVTLAMESGITDHVW